MYDRRARFSEPSLAAGRGRIVFTGPAHCSGLPGARLRSQVPLPCRRACSDQSQTREPARTCGRRNGHFHGRARPAGASDT